MERRKLIELAVKGFGFGAVSYGTTNWFQDGVYGIMGNSEAQRNLDRPTTYRVHPQFFLNEVPINLIGVAHHSAVLKDNLKHIEEQVKKSKVIVLEYFDREIRDRALPGLKNRITDELKSHNQEANLFFAGVGSLCAENQTDVVTINPETYNNQRMEMYCLSDHLRSSLLSF